MGGRILIGSVCWKFTLISAPGGADSPKPPPYPSPPDWRTEGIFLPAIFWKPRSLGSVASVLSVPVVWLDFLQCFLMNAGAKYEAVKSRSWLDCREAISADRATDPSPAAPPATSPDGRP